MQVVPTVKNCTSIAAKASVKLSDKDVAIISKASTAHNIPFGDLAYEIIGALSTGADKKSLLENVAKHGLAFETCCIFDKARSDYELEQMETSVNILRSSVLFVCKRCKNKDCSYYQLQIRSADEPITNFITCMKCKHRWRE
jgi:DNA-directed RNA polymerase subunit M/transcription elongation factor TFIIS